MEMLVIALIALASFAAVLFPLLRRRPGVGDEREFENIPQARTPQAEAPPADGAPASTPPADRAPANTSPASTPPPSASSGGVFPGNDPVEAEILRYRAAVRAGTVCTKCGQANPASSVYCFECGARLPLADAKEFE